ncbi:MAG: hypothetical protein ACYC09_14755 [Bacteroidota bacterium]
MERTGKSRSISTINESEHSTMAKDGIKIIPNKRYLIGTGKDKKVFAAGKEVVVTEE